MGLKEGRGQTGHSGTVDLAPYQSSVPVGFLQDSRACFRAAVAQEAQRWADTAECRKQRDLTSKFHTPSNLCLVRESSAGNPPYVFLYYKELQSMSSFLFKPPHIAGKQNWLADQKCHQEDEGTHSDRDRGAVPLPNEILVLERFSFSLAAYLLDFGEGGLFCF